jgi:hypothetical protein
LAFLFLLVGLLLTGLCWRLSPVLREEISSYPSASSSKEQPNPSLAALERKKKDLWVSDDPTAIHTD